MKRAAPVQHSWPELTCFGRGQPNPGGIRLESYLDADGETLVASVDPDERFTSGAPNVAYGGFVASPVDCHSIWTAMTFAHRAEDRLLDSEPRVTFVTGRSSVEYHEPTPPDRAMTCE